MIDMFANRFSKQAPCFWTLDEDPQALGRDAFTESWENIEGYAFPPHWKLYKVLCKIRSTKFCRIILITPMWR
jgi:hypothetical protein